MLFKSADLFIGSGGNKNNSAGSGHGAAEIFGACVPDAFCNKGWIFTQRHLPADCTIVQVDGIQRTPGRSNGGGAVGVDKEWYLHRITDTATRSINITGVVLEPTVTLNWFV